MSVFDIFVCIQADFLCSCRDLDVEVLCVLTMFHQLAFPYFFAVQFDDRIRSILCFCFMSIDSDITLKACCIQFGNIEIQCRIGIDTKSFFKFCTFAFHIEVKFCTCIVLVYMDSVVSGCTSCSIVSKI